ncbi:16S rRNA (uracil(1498)-N(3))-methyltransferase [Mobilitalea sibirica]|uniref:Ribosomal RNA small subunit methyltransferase E n=1 Tax=Mobilitalea sibirica TaxID=1462919 RepID=A0A8J7HCY6_9FIRM|nr:16S rRNA (uracil(1498)-N(3))-methyltransferase [Mobilitalea sibirica]MBH1941437.1 16S rRNA (uracil(1498)-N(3))-methyltransferase [Mobilitalea sibirica]
MHRFYVTPEQIQGETILITGPDVNHIKNVLRIKPGEEIVICNGQGKDCYCIINRVSEREIEAKISSVKETETELKTRITLFQGLPKKDKMELIIQKAVELGVYEIVPVMTHRTVIKLEDKKKEEKKLERWQSIAESAAKQSVRGIIPKILPVMSYGDALKKAKEMDLAVIPYENAKGIQYTKEIMQDLINHKTIGVFIGPEGGFEKTEIELAGDHNIKPITLGRRILRTETAGFAVLSMMMLNLEE